MAMTKKGSIANAVYVIDGVAQEFTPAQLLAAVSEPAPDTIAADGSWKLVDESVDPKVSSMTFDPDKVDSYLESVLNAERQVPMACSGTYTRVRIASALIDSLWLRGHFRLEDLALKASWSWNFGAMGAGAAFYESVVNASEYIDALGIKFCETSCKRTSGRGRVRFKPQLSAAHEDGEVPFFSDSGNEELKLTRGRTCSTGFVPDPRSWVVYVPFDTSDYRLGGSLLAQTLGLGGGASPMIDDADYFMDCFEVVRELSEDGILLSAATVGEGGLLKALSGLASAGTGLSLDISDIMRAAQEKNPVRVLFSEVPGVVIQIRDSDFDYLDAELLLQDVAFYPLGHPTPGNDELRVKSSAKTGIQNILESLILNAEGED